LGRSATAKKYIYIYIYYKTNKILFSVDDLIEVHFVGYLYTVDLINARKVERITQFSTVSWLSFVCVYIYIYIYTDYFPRWR